VLYAALRALPVPEEPVAWLWHAATLLREHRGDGHRAALVAEAIGGTEAHVLHSPSEGIPAKQFGRVHYLSEVRLTGVVEAMPARGLIEASGWLSDAGRERSSGSSHSPTTSQHRHATACGRPSSTSSLQTSKPISAALDAAGSR
jgi:hypothetical protein